MNLYDIYIDRQKNEVIQKWLIYHEGNSMLKVFGLNDPPSGH